MTKTRKLLVLTLVAFNLTLTSCSKDGKDGAIGPSGIQGDDGQNGIDGNANVIASAWLEPDETSYSVNNPTYKSLTLTSVNSRNNQVILVYYDNDINVHLVPKYYFLPSGDITKSISSSINHASRTLNLSIRKYGSNLTPSEYLWDADGPAYGKGVRFRYVIIPSSTTGKLNHPNFLKMSYKEVMDYFKLDY